MIHDRRAPQGALQRQPLLHQGDGGDRRISRKPMGCGISEKLACVDFRHVRSTVPSTTAATRETLRRSMRAWGAAWRASRARHADDDCHVQETTIALRAWSHRQRTAYERMRVPLCVGGGMQKGRRSRGGRRQHRPRAHDLERRSSAAADGRRSALPLARASGFSGVSVSYSTRGSEIADAALHAMRGSRTVHRYTGCGHS